MLFTNNVPASVASDGNFDKKEIERHSVDYSDCSHKFYRVSKDFSKQYAHIYAARLNTFRHILTEEAHKRWANQFKILKLCDLREKTGTCIIIGTLFKHQQLKPSILKELSDELEIIPQPKRTHFVHDSDTLVLEDELQRIKLIGDCININKVVTGVVCAVLGSEDEDGTFTMKDVCWAECSIQKPIPKIEVDRYVVFVSGLMLTSKKADHYFSLHLLLEWLAGLSGTVQYQEELSKVVRVIIAGGAFTMNENVASVTEGDIVESAGLVDEFCLTLSNVAPLDIMPGCKDPAGIMLPQRPFHYCLFPKSIEYKSFNRVSNPYDCVIGGLRCIGSSGEPLRNIMDYSNIDNALEAMELTLQWRHLAPTAPDTVPCAPCIDTDPFIMYDCPSVYFSGNCDQFGTSIYEGSRGQQVRLVSIPNFYTTKTVALVNLSNLECYSMSFS